MGCMTSPAPVGPRTISDDDVERVIVKTLEETPADATHWSTRSMASRDGMSQSAVSRIWRAFGLKPHRVEELQAVAGPAVHRQGPRHRRALPEPARRGGGAVRRREDPGPGAGSDRADPAVAARAPARRTHDYNRNGTTNLYAALDIASGHVIADLTPATAPRSSAGS